MRSLLPILLALLLAFAAGDAPSVAAAEGGSVTTAGDASQHGLACDECTIALCPAGHAACGAVALEPVAARVARGAGQRPAAAPTRRLDGAGTEIASPPPKPLLG